MEFNEHGNRNVTDGLWHDFAEEMNSSCFAAMQRLAVEASRTDEEDTEVENRNGHEAEMDIDNVLNEEEIAAGGDEVANEGDELSEDETDEVANARCGWLKDETDEDVNMSDKSPEAVTDEGASASNESSKAAIDEDIFWKNIEASVHREDIAFREEKKNCVKLRHFISDDVYFFVLDLIEAVEEKRDEDVPEREVRRQSYPFYFSDVQKYLVQKYVNSQEQDFISVIKEYTPADSICVFETCKDEFKKRYKPKEFKASDFVNFCAAIAYLGFYCSKKGLDPKAKRKSTNCICSLLYELVQQKLIGKLNWRAKDF